MREKAEHLILSLSVECRKIVAGQTKTRVVDQILLFARVFDRFRYSGAHGDIAYLTSLAGQSRVSFVVGFSFQMQFEHGGKSRDDL